MRIPFLSSKPHIPVHGPVSIDPPPASCQSPPITNEELHQRLVRIETRLVKFMQHMGAPTHEEPWQPRIVAHRVKEPPKDS